MKMMKNVNEHEYEIYEPMIDGLRVDENLPVYYNLIFLGRRIVFVIAIFFLVEINQKIWQALLFCYSSLSVLIFTIGARPYDTKYRNKIEVFNECNVLMVGYFALQLLYSSWSPIMMNEVGFSILNTIICGMVLNCIMILKHNLKSVKLAILRCKKRSSLRRMKIKKIEEIALETKKTYRENRT